MRFLCLHGMGTNARIFEHQTAAIRQSLGSGHTYEWLEGAVKTQMAPGIQDLVSLDDEFLTYVNDTPESQRQAMTDLEHFIAGEGPFDGLMGFSLGAGCGATYLLDHLQQGGKGRPPFRCAVFFSGAPPLQAKSASPGPRLLIDIPTVHVWGLNDLAYGYGPALSRWCNAEQREVVLHEGGHEIPGPRDPLALARTVQAIKRTLAKAAAAI
ncbi:hypothetical protein BO94DRAFT_586880 [Aspergillus sclerotioniger CBS 115572]|uniref:Serine hydrolase domain-containing protein n=1 Tax=Aspergillus sclerotioniger CBS 115572 TaxID=1450535 RepID=A0A317WF31_9EURO|nr:hypothetical protein BO94DRAFT_586880 [Aspergillus sclerotioniger CBS 115572]PWY83832.1 hypothetical protein BO94DRAFT_586880 [Aspergillus sclerotioniger CBS 115572]